jgi:tRNA threonylcarbamoyladenosine biosynthesis protein TsaE
VDDHPAERRVLTGAEEMQQFGRELGRQLQVGDVVLLHGDLGSGKTTLTQGIAAALGIDGMIQSPTFTLMSEYPTALADGTHGTLYHLDLYRLQSTDELGDIGWDEAIDPELGVTVIEWPERASDWLPSRAILVSITHAGVDARSVTVCRLGTTVDR